MKGKVKKSFKCPVCLSPNVSAMAIYKGTNKVHFVQWYCNVCEMVVKENYAKEE